MKNSTMKNKFALCFRPVGIETEDADHKRHVTSDNHDRDRVVAECKNIVVSKEHKNRKMATGILGSESPKISCLPRSETGSRKALSRVLKSILFETSPGIRVNDGKNRQITFPQSNESSNMVDDKPSKMKKRESINAQQVSKSSSFSSTTSSTSTASVSPSSESNDDSKSLKKRAFARSRSNSFDQMKKPKTTKTNDRTYSTKEDLVLYLIILALLATIIWGKILAVLLTTLCLYILPMGLNGLYWLPENSVTLPEMETSKEHKKRVIMKGLLERKPIQRALNL